MAGGHAPRHGSMQYWPRKKARKQTASVRYWAPVHDAKFLGFGGYKAGMTHLMVVDNRHASVTKGEEISMPVTILECPPLKIAAVRFYGKENGALCVRTEVWLKTDKELARKIVQAKKDTAPALADIESKLGQFVDMKVIAYTQPKLSSIGKKRPEVFELGIGGKNVEEKYNFVKQHFNKEISLKEVFQTGALVDIHAVTKGKGYQGPVKRFGVSIRQHKAEKTKRGPGSLGAWCGQSHMMYRVAHAGQMGYHTRTEYNKQIIMIDDDGKKVNPAGGFLRYGNIKTSYILIKGSLPGPTKRFIRFNVATRPTKRFTKDAPSVEYISTESKM